MLNTLSPVEIEDVLRSQARAHLWCQARGRTHLIPISYVYDDGDLVGRAAEGLKLRLMRESPSLCVEVSRADDSVHSRHVVASGRFEELAAASADTATIYRIHLYKKRGRIEAS